jgi:uncharacterized protein (DUF433 family)
MQLEDYFEFEKHMTKFGEVERIRIKGHRISIEHVIEHHRQGLQPAEIVSKVYPTLTLEEVYATITYYLHNQAEVDAYMARGEQIAEAYYQEYLQQEPPEVVKRLRALRDKPEELRRFLEERKLQGQP